MVVEWKMEKILVKMEEFLVKMEKMEKILVILVKIITIQMLQDLCWRFNGVGY